MPWAGAGSALHLQLLHGALLLVTCCVQRSALLASDTRCIDRHAGRCAAAMIQSGIQLWSLHEQCHQWSGWGVV
jgi:hypothetical protein